MGAVHVGKCGAKVVDVRGRGQAVICYCVHESYAKQIAELLNSTVAQPREEPVPICTNSQPGFRAHPLGSRSDCPVCIARTNPTQEPKPPTEITIEVDEPWLAVMKALECAMNHTRNHERLALKLLLSDVVTFLTGAIDHGVPLADLSAPDRDVQGNVRALRDQVQSAVQDATGPLSGLDDLLPHHWQKTLSDAAQALHAAHDVVGAARVEEVARAMERLFPTE